jgi:hypothetical protein
VHYPSAAITCDTRITARNRKQRYELALTMFLSTQLAQKEASNEH